MSDMWLRILGPPAIVLAIGIGLAIAVVLKEVVVWLAVFLWDCLCYAIKGPTTQLAPSYDYVNPSDIDLEFCLPTAACDEEPE